jgi:hypothetical protein
MDIVCFRNICINTLHKGDNDDDDDDDDDDDNNNNNNNIYIVKIIKILLNTFIFLFFCSQRLYTLLSFQYRQNAPTVPLQQSESF